MKNSAYCNECLTKWDDMHASTCSKRDLKKHPITD
jgi:hypothetical protein